ncbi:MAG: MFS transporter [Opitutales bacterium]|nr:MFS transporter [Opitutales bacterium]
MSRHSPLITSRLPPGIPFIIGNEVAERFSFYGMRSILLAYMTLYLTQPDGTLGVLGEKSAEAWVHLFVGSAYFFPIIGGFVADAFWGKYKTIIILSLCYCLGHGCLAFMGIWGDTRLWLLGGLLLIAIGSGGIKPCVSSHVGDQFCDRNKHLITKVFGWFYFSINLGAFASGLLTPFLLEARRVEGSLGETIYPYTSWFVGPRDMGDVIFGHHYAFGLPGVLMAVATLIFWLGRKDFTHIPPRGISLFRETFSPENIKILLRLSLIFSFVILFWALFDQIGTLWQVQARSLDRTIPDWIPWVGGMEMLASQVSAVWNPLFILILIPCFSSFVYPFFEKYFTINPLGKMRFGLWVMGLSFAMVSWIQMKVDDGLQPSVMWQVLACLVLTISEILVSITCLEFAYTQAPKSLKSVVMALFLLTVSFGNYVASGVKFFLIDQNGNSLLPGASEFWFWTILVCLSALLFRLVASRYKTVDYFH